MHKTNLNGFLLPCVHFLFSAFQGSSSRFFLENSHITQRIMECSSSCIHMTLDYAVKILQKPYKMMGTPFRMNLWTCEGVCNWHMSSCHGDVLETTSVNDANNLTRGVPFLWICKNCLVDCEMHQKVLVNGWTWIKICRKELLWSFSRSTQVFILH